MGDLEKYLKQNDLWDTTTCILTSDHWWRIYRWDRLYYPLNQEEIGLYKDKIDHRVPLFIKLKHQKKGVEYQADTSTIFMKELISHLVDNTVQTPKELACFLDQKRESGTPAILKWEGLKH
ncbi:MAG: hypothetical protein WCN87_02900 [Chlamydiota bacterium]